MNPLRVDVAVLGGGFAGSLMAMLLERIGLKPVLIERGSHPRFAIGESSTPVADLVLADLAREYDLPRLAPLAKYGSWKRAYPDIIRGLKRGFSYFHHSHEEPFHPSDEHHNELLVAASSDDEHGDTHWLRSDVDAFLFREVERLGVPTFDRTQVALSADGRGWRLTAVRESHEFEVQARFVIDATGGAGIVPRALNIPITAEGMHTHSRAIYGHFVDVVPWHDVLNESGAHVSDHPFDCDHSALHHLLEEGWMWQLRFDNGITSAGFVIDSSQDLGHGEASPQDEWCRILHRYPSLARQFAGSRRIAPADGLHASRRMQRLASQVAGQNWAFLPSSAGFVDPLHSTGIAHTLCGIERLTRILSEHWQQPTFAEQLASYDRLVQQEFGLIDLLVHGCYATRMCFRAFAAFGMLYFAAATSYERSRLEGQRGGFLCADDPRFVDVVKSLWSQLPTRTEATSTDVACFEQEVARRLSPYNHAGLCDPAVRNMYARTSLPLPAE